MPKPHSKRAKKRARKTVAVPAAIRDRLKLICHVMQTVANAIRPQDDFAAMVLLEHGLYPLSAICEELERAS